MTRTHNIPLTKRDLEALLDIHGADRHRWPTALRDPVDDLVARDSEARKLLRDAGALDRLLAKAPAPGSTDAKALAGRIVAAALRGPEALARKSEAGDAPPPTNVIAWPGRSEPRPAVSLPNRSDAWRGAALLAASLMLGIFVGVSNVGSAQIEDIAVATGLVSASDPALNALEQNDLIGLDEEAL